MAYCIYKNIDVQRRTAIEEPPWYAQLKKKLYLRMGCVYVVVGRSGRGGGGGGRGVGGGSGSGGRRGLGDLNQFNIYLHRIE